MVNQDNKHFAGCKSEKGLLESGAPGIGHNSGGAPEALSPDEIVAIEASWRNATLPARIVLAYVQGRAPAFSPGQRGSELSQTAILQNATLRCLVAMARADRQMDLRPVLVALIASFSANKHWRSSVSLARLAKMLDRNERTIRRYLVKLVQERWVVQVDRAGFTTAYTLAFTELDATPGLSPTLILDVLAPKEGGRWGRGHWEPNDSACPGPRITLDTIATEASSITPDNMLSGVGNLAPDTNCDSPGHTGCPQNKDSKNIILEGAPPKFASEDDDCLTKQAHKSRPLRPEQKVQIGQISAWDKANPPAGYIYERGVFASAVSVASEYLGIFRFVDIAEQVNLMLPCGANPQFSPRIAAPVFGWDLRRG